MTRLAATLAAVLALLLIAAPAHADPGPVTIGAVDPGTGQWYLTDVHGNSRVFYFGNPADEPFAGDWDCDGVDTPGLYRRSDGFVYLRNSNTPDVADVEFFFGDPGDLPLPGDFDGDGCDTVSIYRPSEGRVYVHNQLGSASAGLGQAELAYYFGNPADEPFTGDFDGDGVDEVGLHRDTTGLVYMRLTHTQGPADLQFTYGDPADRILAGDWTDDGTDTVAIFRPRRGRYYLRHANAAGSADAVIAYGDDDWRPVAGRFGLGGSPTGRGTVVLSGTGDINPSPGYGPDPRFPERAWTGLDGIFLEDDLTVVNLECSPGLGGAPWPKTFTFRCDQRALPVMKEYGVEVASLANNHSIDYGHQAMLDGRQRLIDNGIVPVGAGRNEAEAEEAAVFDVNGWKIAVVGLGGVVPFGSWVAGPNSPGHADGDSIPKMVRAVEAAAAVADLVVVTIHWGTEVTFVPDRDDVVRAQAMIDAGADIIFGHHQHRLQPLEVVDGAHVFWGLSHLVWQSRPRNWDTAVGEVVIMPDGLMFSRRLPVRIVADGHPVLLD